MTRRVGEVRGRRWRWLAWVLIPLGLLLVVGANAHLVYVAVQSQPGCVEQVKAAGEGKVYRAAKSGC
jgi:hypothetical protein